MHRKEDIMELERDVLVKSTDGIKIMKMTKADNIVTYLNDQLCKRKENKRHAPIIVN